MHENKPSQTAYGVAAAVLLLSSDKTETGFITQEYADQLAELMRAIGQMSALTTRIFRSRFMAWVYRASMQ